MKTYNQLKVRSIGTKLAVLGLTLMLAASCGSSKKNVTTTATSTSTSTLATNDVNFASQWNNFKGRINCNTGGQRSMDRYYYSNQNSVNLTSGSISGSASGTYFGQHSDGHAFAVQKITQGNSVNYNVVVSLCEYTSYNYGQTITALGNNDSLSNPQMSATRINSNCAYDGMSGYFGVMSSRLGTQVQLSFAPSQSYSQSCN